MYGEIFRADTTPAAVIANKIKLRSFKSIEYINEKGVGHTAVLATQDRQVSKMLVWFAFRPSQLLCSYRDAASILGETTQLVCLFELILNVPVNNYGQVGTLPPFYGGPLPQNRMS